MGGACDTCEVMRNAYQILAKKHEGKKPLISMHRGEDNIKMYLKEIRWNCVDWIHLAQDRDCWWAPQ
jgi:hypothetical protein